MSKSKSGILQLIFDIAKAIGVAFLIFFACQVFILASIEGEDRQIIIGTLLTVLFIIFYSVAFYLMHVRKCIADYALDMKDEKYSFKSDIKNVLAGEGKQLAVVYGILAVIMQICMLIPVRIPVTVILMPLFPIYMVLNVPVLSGLLGWIIATAGSILTSAYGHSRLYIMRAKGKL